MMDHNNFTVKTYMAIMAERDAAIRERNMALEERKRAFAERDMAMLQRDAALAERNAAIQDRDDAITALRLRGSDVVCSVNDEDDDNMVPDSLVSGADQAMHEEAARGAAEAGSTKRVRRGKESKRSNKRKVGPDGLNLEAMCTTSDDWVNLQDLDSDDNKEGDDLQMASWKDNLGLNQINFDESAMPVPVCSCTGTPQPCYKWGHGGWQSACCTTTISMYPLPQISNKRYSRVGGRKMSGGAFSKLLNRLAAQGYDLSVPLDLKDHWAKHGTNRYSTLK